MTRFWFDTEFIEDGESVELLSIGFVSEDGREYYAEPAEADRARAGDWVKANVLPHMNGPVKSRAQIATDLIQFLGPQPEIWAYYAAYDWVLFCRLFGTMMDLPGNWPRFCRDLKQLAGDRLLIPQTTVAHNALSDALWTKAAFDALAQHTSAEA